MSLDYLRRRYFSILMFFNDYPALIYCFTISTLTISGGDLIESIVLDNEGFGYKSIFRFFIPLVILNIFFFVSYLVNRRVHLFRTMVKVSLVSILLVVPIIYLKFLDVSKSTEKVMGFTDKKVSIYGTVISQEKEYTFMFHSQGGGMGNSLIRFINYPVLHVGQRCKIYGKVVQPKSFNDFDYKRYLFRKGVYSIVDVQEYKCDGIGNIFLDSRYRLERIVEKALPEPEASLLIGIMFGSKRVFTKDFNDALNGSGVSHVIAASGYNVALVAQAIDITLRNRGGRGGILIKILCIWIFSIFSGLSSSLIRASTLTSISLIGNFFGRDSNKGGGLMLCATVLILINPFIIHDVGFLFSFVSVLGLIYFPKCFESIRSKYIKESILPTVTCILFTLPISVIFFGKMSAISLISNIIVIPIISQTIFWGLGITVINIFFNLKILFLIPYIQLSIFKYFVMISSNVKMVELGVNKYIFTIFIYLILFLFCLYRYPVSSNNYYILLSKKK